MKLADFLDKHTSRHDKMRILKKMHGLRVVIGVVVVMTELIFIILLTQ